MNNTPNKARLRVSPEVARILAPTAPRELLMSAARGAVPLSGRDLITALFFLLQRDSELRLLAQATLRELPASLLVPILRDPDWPSPLLDYLARLRSEDRALLQVLFSHAGLPSSTLLALAERSAAAPDLLAHNQRLLERYPGLVEALLANPATDRATRFRLGRQEPAAEPEGDEEDVVAADGPDDAGGPAAAELGDDPEDEEPGEAEEELNQSKYQQALEMGVSEKIKMALTGDKEWRSIFIKDPNKLVHSAVLKNPRITEGEVLTIAKNKSSSDEMIRLITLNREWLKNYAIKKALIFHPRTPLQNALRYMTILGEKDLKALAKSRGVSQVIVNAARRVILQKDKKK